MVYRYSTILLFIFSLSLIGCGGGGAPATVTVSELSACHASGSDQFINHTALTQAQLLAQWHQAQQDVGVTGVYLDPANQREFKVDARALSESPNCLLVESKADVPVATLAQVTGNPAWLGHGDPSGSIFWVDGKTAVHSYVSFNVNPHAVFSAESIVGPTSANPKNGTNAPIYEEQNELLHRLGYSTDKR